MSQPTLSPMNVLLVEDEATNRMIAEVILQHAGHHVTVAENGEEALRLCHDQARQFDLALLDVQMPVLDGLETAQRMRAHPATESLPIVYLTACASREDITTGFEAGGDAYVTKPYSRRELLLGMQEALSRRGVL